MCNLRTSLLALVRVAVAWAVSVGFFACPVSAGQNIISKTVEPAVIPSKRSSGAVVTVRTDLPASSVVIDLEAGGTVPFLAINSTTFSAALTPAQLLFDYFPDDVNRNLVGLIKVTGAAQEETDVKNLFVNVDDSSVTDVQVVTSASDMRCAPHVVNLLVPAGDPSELWESLVGQEASILTRFYEEFGDDYDFANVVYLHPDSFLNRDHFAVKNDVSGIGQPLIDQTAQYGSAGALRGITRFPLDTVFDLAEPGAQHELGHQWINFLVGPPLLAGGSPHWPPSQLARGLMGATIPATGAGGTFPFDIVQTPTGFELVASPPTGLYTQLDLYVMGFVPSTAVPPFLVLDPPGQTLAVGPVTASQLTIDDVIDVHGAREPGPATIPPAPKDFRMATIVVTRTGFLTNRQLAFFDHFAARGEAVAPVTFASGFQKGTANPFAVATQGIGSLDTSLTCPIPEFEPPPFEEVAICRFCPPDPCTNCPGLIRAIDQLIYPEVRVPEVLAGLHTKLLNAGAAYQRGQHTVAANVLKAFQNQIRAQQGKALSEQAATAITALTFGAARALQIPLEGGIER